MREVITIGEDLVVTIENEAGRGRRQPVRGPHLHPSGGG